MQLFGKGALFALIVTIDLLLSDMQERLQWRILVKISKNDLINSNPSIGEQNVK